MNTQFPLNLKRQKGFSKLGLLMTFVILICVLTFGLKVLPIYLDHNYVKNIAQDMVDTGEAAEMTQTQIRNQIANGLRVNNVHDFDLDSISSSRSNGKASIEIKYEKRVPLVSNIDVIVSFDDRIN